MSHFFCFLCYLSLIVIRSEYSNYISDDTSDCDNYWFQINSTCSNYYTPTIAIQTLSTNTNSLESYTQISLPIRANHDVIITPHCISMDIAINPSIMSYLSREWLSNNVEWPQYHEMGDIITFGDKSTSEYITFNNPCMIAPNTTTALILLFNTNFNGYWIQTQCTKYNRNTITIYDEIYRNTIEECSYDSDSLPITSISSWNLYIVNESTTTDAIDSSEINQIIYEFIDNTHQNTDYLILGLIIIIVVLNICCCALLWYFNQKQFHENITEISKTVQQIHSNQSYKLNLTTHNENNDNDNDNDEHDDIQCDISCIATANSASVSTDTTPSTAPSPSVCSKQRHAQNVVRNGIVWVNKTYFDSNSTDEHNLFKIQQMHMQAQAQSHNSWNNSVSGSDLNIETNDAQSPKQKLDKLRIVLPPNNKRVNLKSMHSRSDPRSDTTLSAMTLSADGFLSPSNTIVVRNMDPIHENEATPFTKHSTCNDDNDSVFSVSSSIRLPAYHPNNIKVLNDNNHIPYNKTFIIAVTPPIPDHPTIIKGNRYQKIFKKEHPLQLALPQTNQTNTAIQR